MIQAIVSLIGISGFIFGVGAAEVDGDDLQSWVNEYIDREYVQRVDTTPSLVCVIVKDGTSLVALGVGYEDEARTRVVDPDTTVFKLASNSKLFVAVCALQLAEVGRINLDAEVDTLLNAFSIRNRFERRVTVRHLLTHTSGIDSFFLGCEAETPEDRLALREFFRRHPPTCVRHPGKAIVYSNHGMALAALVVEQISGLPFHEFVRRRVLVPLGMHRSTFVEPLPSSLSQQLARAGAPPDGPLTIPYPAATLVASGTDIARFLNFTLGQTDSEVLTDSSRQQLLTRQFTQHDEMPGVAFGFFEHFHGDLRGLFHTGLKGHHSLVYLLPRDRLGVFLAYSARQGTGASKLSRRILPALLDHLYPGESTSTAVAEGLAFDPVRPRTGRYRPAIVTRSNFERIIGIPSDVTLTHASEAGFTIRHAGRPPLHFARQQADLWRTGDGISATHADGDAQRDLVYLAGGLHDPIALERLAWFEHPRLHGLIAVAAFVSFAASALAGLWMLLHRADHQARWGPVERCRCFISIGMIAVPSLLLFPLLASRDRDSSVSMDRWSLLPMSLATVAGIAAIGSAIATVVACVSPKQTLREKLHDAWFSLVAVSWTMVLAYWNLILTVR